MLCFKSWAQKNNCKFHHELHYVRFQASTMVYLRCSLFWYVTWHRLVIGCQHFGTACWSCPFFLDCLTLEDGTHRLSQMSGTNYQPTPHNILEEQRPWIILVEKNFHLCWISAYQVKHQFKLVQQHSTVQQFPLSKQPPSDRSPHPFQDSAST
jgi:hypothetical protein